LVDKRIGGNRSKLQELEIRELTDTLHQYTPRERLGDKSSTAHGRFWSVEDLSLLLREKYSVEYKRRVSYIELLHRCGFSYQKTEKVYKNHSQIKVADFEEELEKK
jgi:transposase